MDFSISQWFFQAIFEASWSLLLLIEWSYIYVHGDCNCFLRKKNEAEDYLTIKNPLIKTMINEKKRKLRMIGSRSYVGLWDKKSDKGLFYTKR